MLKYRMKHRENGCARYVITAIIAVVAMGLLVPTAFARTAELGIVPGGYMSEFPTVFSDQMQALNTGARTPAMIRVDVLWPTIAPTKPADPTDPDDPAYQWGQLDETMKTAAQTGGKVLATVYWTPSWASATRAHGANSDLPNVKAFASFLTALQTRYSGTTDLPAVSNWELWNESNNEFFLKASGGKSAKALKTLVTHYASMLSSGRTALRATAAAMGTKAPTVIAGAVGGTRGFAHTVFFRALSEVKTCKGAASSKCFDAVSVHPYSPNPRVDALGTRVNGRWATIGNFSVFAASIKKDWPGRKLPIWVTEFGWQTNPPENYLGVAPNKQATLMQQSVTKFRKDFKMVPHMLWFLLEDEPDVGRWQSGLVYANGQLKPSWNTFHSILKK